MTELLFDRWTSFTSFHFWELSRLLSLTRFLRTHRNSLGLCYLKVCTTLMPYRERSISPSRISKPMGRVFVEGCPCSRMDTDLLRLRVGQTRTSVAEWADEVGIRFLSS